MVYMDIRFVSATCLPIMWISGLVLTLELFGKECQKSIAMVKDFFTPMSELVLGTSQDIERGSMFGQGRISELLNCCHEVLAEQFIPLGYKVLLAEVENKMENWRFCPFAIMF